MGEMALIALGANLAPDGIGLADHIRAVVSRLSDRFGAGAHPSALYRTPAFPAGAGPDFVNAVIRIDTDLAPDALLALLHEIEAAHGRTRFRRWAPRPLDLDLIALGDLVLPGLAEWANWYGLPLDQQAEIAPDRLILPHPRLQERAFVLVPLCDVAPDWVHPVLHRTAADLCAALPPALIAEVSAIDGS